MRYVPNRVASRRESPATNFTSAVIRYYTHCCSVAVRSYALGEIDDTVNKYQCVRHFWNFSKAEIGMKFYRIVSVYSLMIVSVLTNSQASEWEAGVARAKITPPLLMPMAGYASRGAEHAHRTLIDLWAKVLVLKAGEDEAAIVTLDLLGIDRGLAEQITLSLQQKLNWQRHQIAICTSHTHTGPVVAKNLRPMHYLILDDNDRQLVDDYASFVYETVVELVVQARNDLQPSILKWGSGTATFATNRRTNPEAEVPQLRAAGILKGPVDHDVPVLCVEQQGKLKAIMFGYACHCTTLSSFEWSGDYAGFAQIELEKLHPDCTAMFWAGCGGDQNPLPRRTVEFAKGYGEQLATAVHLVTQAQLRAITPKLNTNYREIDLKYAQLPDRAKLTEESESSNKHLAARAKWLLQELDDKKELSKTYPYPIQIWKLGEEVQFVLLGGEVVIDYAVRIKEELGANELNQKNVWCAAYTNDVMAYIPSLRVLTEGGYEGGGAMIYYGLPTIWAPEVEQDIMQAVHDMVKAR